MLLKITQLSGDYKVGPAEVQYHRCPVCGHEGWGKFYVNRRTGVWHCHAGSHRGGGGRVVDHHLLPGYTTSGTPGSLGEITQSYQERIVELPDNQSIVEKSPAYKYIVSKRGISIETCNQLHVRDWTEEGRVLIPFFNQKGDIIGYTGRDYYGTSSLKYRNHSGNRVLYVPSYGVPSSANESFTDLAVVEGPLDAVAVHQCLGAAPGWLVVALGGLDIAQHLRAQAAGLARGRRVLVWADADDAGRSAALSVARRLGPYARQVTIFEQPQGKDAASLSAEELARILLDQQGRWLNRETERITT